MEQKKIEKAFPRALQAAKNLLFLFQTGMLLTMTQVIWLKVAAAF